MKKSYNHVKLSSKWTTIGYYGSIILYALVSPIILFTAWENQDTNSLFALVVWLALSAFLYIVIKYTSLMYIKDNYIFAKKFFHAEERFNLNSLRKIKTYDTLRDKYIVITLNKNGISQKHLIMHSKLFYPGESMDAENILNEIILENKTTI